MSNLERFRKDLEALVTRGRTLLVAMRHECFPVETEKQLAKTLKTDLKTYVGNLPVVAEEYQRWYSESKAVVRQLLPDRLQDFVSLYEKPKARKALTCDAYSRTCPAPQARHGHDWANAA